MTSVVSDIAEHTAVSARQSAYPARPQSCAAARRDVGTALRDLRLDADAVDIGVLAVSELFTNAILHHPARPGEEVTVRLCTKAGPGGTWVVVSVIDGGIGAIGASSRGVGSHESATHGEANQESGRGLTLLRGLGIRVLDRVTASGYEVTAVYPAHRELRRRVCQCDCISRHPGDTRCLMLVPAEAVEAGLIDGGTPTSLCSHCQPRLATESVGEASGIPAQISGSSPSSDRSLMDGDEDAVPTFVPLLTPAQIAALPERAQEVVEYRKSGLSLNHVQGCPLGCAYCIRHTYGVWDMDQPRALCDNAEAVRQLVEHPYFQPHITPLQLFNRATEPFLPKVKEHLFAVLEDLDARGLTNHVLVITRYRLDAADCDRLNGIKHLKMTLLFTYSGIEDSRVEPFNSRHAEVSLRLASSLANRYRTVLYWRPLVPGLNDSVRHLAHAVALSRVAHATVFTGLFYRDQIAEYYRANHIPEPYDATARRKIVPETLEARVLRAFEDGAGGALFRKTSCAVSYAHGLPDYNGHFGIRAELCDICPLGQVEICRGAHRVPTQETVRRIAAAVPGLPDFEIDEISERAVTVSGLDEQPRYYLQHSLGFQVHDSRHPHNPHRHGRAEIGWAGQPESTGATP